MSDADHVKFQRLMKDYYKSKSERAEKQFSDLWDVCCGLLHAVLDVEYDEPSIEQLKNIAREKIPQMETILTSVTRQES